jgi:hypothetical protein
MSARRMAGMGAANNPFVFSFSIRRHRFCERDCDPGFVTLIENLLAAEVATVGDIIEIGGFQGGIGLLGHVGELCQVAPDVSLPHAL